MRHTRAGTCTHTRQSRQRKSSTGRANSSWGLVVVGAETTPHRWSHITTRTRQLAGPHTNGPHGENPPASRRDCNVMICKSRNLAIISTETRTLPPFHKVQYLIQGAPALRIRSSSPRSTTSELRCTSKTAAKALAVLLMRIGLERLDLNGENTKADDFSNEERGPQSTQMTGPRRCAVCHDASVPANQIIADPPIFFSTPENGSASAMQRRL